MLHIFDSARELSAIDCVGLEIKLAMVVAGDEDTRANEGDNDYWLQKCRLLFLRPAIEPIAISYWNRLLSLDLDLKRTQKIVSALSVKEQVFRNGEGVGRSLNGDVGFEPIERAHGWLDRLKTASGVPELASFMPMYTFATVIMAHPFGDGNGRFARVMTLGALARFAGWKAPIIGLAPSFYRHAEALGSALDDVTRTQDWTGYVTVFLDILEDASKLVSGLRLR